MVAFEPLDKRERASERARERERERERERFLTITKRLKVGTHNALSCNTASGCTGPAYDGGSERARGRKCERESRREKQREEQSGGEEREPEREAGRGRGRGRQGERQTERVYKKRERARLRARARENARERESERRPAGGFFSHRTMAGGAEAAGFVKKIRGRGRQGLTARHS